MRLINIPTILAKLFFDILLDRSIAREIHADASSTLLVVTRKNARTAGDTFQQPARVESQKITLVVVPSPSGWQHSPDDGRVVTKDTTLKLLRAAAVATRRLSERHVEYPLARFLFVELPCFFDLLYF